LAKRTIGSVPFVYPVPIVLVGSLVDGKPNYATVGDCAIMGIKPALVAISLSETHYTTRGVVENRTFGISIPETSQLALVDHFGQVSGRDVDKSQLIDSFYGDLKTAPMAEPCPVCLECKVCSEVTVEHRHIFIGEVAQTHIDEAFVDSEGRVAPLTELDPILYALDNRYYSIGPQIGEGYKEAETLGRQA